MPDRVSILVPYLAQYRVPLFEGMRHRLAEIGITLNLVYGMPVGRQRSRGDAADLDWAVRVKTATVGIGKGKSIKWLRVGKYLEGSDLVVVEQALSNIQMWLLLGKHSLIGPRVAVWGHGRIVTRQSSGWENWLLEWATCRADWFFAYTQGAADSMKRVPSSRVSVLNNTIETSALLEAWNQRAVRPLSRRKSLVFIGGLDTSKGILDLLDAFEEVHSAIPDSELIVIGAGDQAPEVRRRASKEQGVTYLGPLFDEESKAAACMNARAMVLPRRVGLAVVEAFALGLPVVAVADAHHAPEFEYLVDGVNCCLAPMKNLVDGMKRILLDDEYAMRLAHGAKESRALTTMEHMIDVFTRGILSALMA